MGLDELRVQIDKIDNEIVKLLEERLKVVQGVVEEKIKNNLPVFDAGREEIVLNRICEKAENKEFAPYIRNSYIGIMNASKDMQADYMEKNTPLEKDAVYDEVSIFNPALAKGARVVYQGVPGSYSEEAMELFFKGEIESYNVKNFSDVFKEIAAGKADYGILPIENSSTGSVTDTMDLLSSYGFYIVGEVVLPVRHCLLGVPGATIEDIKEVYSHQQGIMQCSEFLEKHPNWLQITYINTALAAKMVAESQDKSKASISSRRAGEIYGLEVLVDKINGKDMNSTRFVIISKDFNVHPEADKISIMFTLPHKSGSLYHALKNFADRGLNMLKIESRPAKDKNWEYLFFLDFTGNISENNSIRAIQELKKSTGLFRLLGNYKSTSEGSE